MHIARAIVIATASFGLSTAAFAHAHLRNAAPAVGATVQAAPSEVAINFTEGLEPRFSTIEVRDKAGVQVDTGTPHLAADDNKHFVVA